jgi:ribosome production factor 2
MAPQLVEHTKKVLVFKGHRTSQKVQDVMHELSLLLKPNVKTLSRKNEVLPFEDLASLEFLASKNDCSLFVLGSHTKKRPDNLVLGRMHDGHLLDMMEFGIEGFSSMTEIEGFKKATGAKVCDIYFFSTL